VALSFLYRLVNRVLTWSGSITWTRTPRTRKSSYCAISWPCCAAKSPVPASPGPIGPSSPCSPCGCRISNKTIYTAGYLPRTLAAVLAPLVPPGDPFNAAVIETVARGGKRIGLKIVGTVGRDMVVKSVSR
jgi:hypothetical protein